MGHMNQSFQKTKSQLNVTFTGGYRGYAKFQEQSDNDVGSDNDNYLVVK